MNIDEIRERHEREESGWAEVNHEPIGEAERHELQNHQDRAWLLYVYDRMVYSEKVADAEIERLRQKIAELEAKNKQSAGENTHLLNQLPDSDAERFYCLSSGHNHKHRYDEALCSARFQLDRAEQRIAELEQERDELRAAVVRIAATDGDGQWFPISEISGIYCAKCGGKVEKQNGKR